MHYVEAKGILTGGKGRYGINIYRGCTHGCIYCDNRSSCYGSCPSDPYPTGSESFLYI